MSHIKYDHYKKSNIYWVGNIPSHWETIPVKHHFFSKKQVAGNLADNYQRLALTLNGVIKRSKEDAEGLQPEKFETYQIVHKDSLIFKLIDLENIKTSRIGLSKWDGLVSPAYIILSSNGDILPNYAEKYFLNMWHEHIFNQLGSVGVRSNLNKEDVLNLPIIKPPLNEQQQIASYLDKKTAKIDTTIAKNEELIQLLEEKRVALINQVIAKGLNPDVPMKDSGVEWIGEIPEHWDVVPFKRLFDNIKDGTHGSFQRVADGEPLLSAKNVFNDTINISENESLISQEDYNSIVANGFPKRNDLLLTIVGTIGRSCVYDKDFPLAFQRSVAFIRLTYDDPYFYNYFVKSDIFFSQLMINAKESAQKGVYLNDIKECLVIRPPIEIQSEIANYLQNHISKINKIISKIQENITLLEEYKTSLIHHVVTGKIDVRGEEI